MNEAKIKDINGKLNKSDAENPNDAQCGYTYYVIRACPNLNNSFRIYIQGTSTINREIAESRAHSSKYYTGQNKL